MAEKASRHSVVNRKTKETDISLELSVDGSGKSAIKTGVPFMDHMLDLLTVHGFFDLTIQAAGDTEIDAHHTVEDIGITLGTAFTQALGDFSAINRYGSAAVPMDETLVRVDLDFSKRPYLCYHMDIPTTRVGDFDTELVVEFFRALAQHGGITLHVELVRGQNSHHIIEAAFKALGRALSQAAQINPNLRGPLSSKGLL